MTSEEAPAVKTNRPTEMGRKRLEEYEQSKVNKADIKGMEEARDAPCKATSHIYM